MEEQLITFKTAKLAKEKGYNIPVKTHHPNPSNTKQSICLSTNWNNFTDMSGNNNYQSAPTQSLLQKWIREKHNIHITIFSSSQESWMYRITKKYQPLEKGLYGEDFVSYEEALEIGLFEALNLIN